MVEFTVECHPDGIRVRSDNHIDGENLWDLPGAADEDVWTIIGREAPELWDLMDEGNTSLEESSEDLLFDGPCDDSDESMPWIVEDDNTVSGGMDIFVERYATREEAVAAAERQWDHLTRREKKGRIIRVGREVQGSPGDLDDMVVYDWDGELAEEEGELTERGMETLTTTKAVTVQGNSLVVKATKELKAMGLGPGDMVEVTLRRI